MAGAYRLRVDSLLGLIDAFDGEVTRFAGLVAEALDAHPGYHAVQAIPGVGPVLAAVFAANGSYATGQSFVDGMVPALRIGAVVVAIGAVVALGLASRVRSTVGATQVASTVEPDIEGATA